ncbi:hypothetical protein HanXRQr2_Chr03g0090571 [Helianthus annuus]|uniref:Uncharacterized protein n=1 Tax=Helianthus annuus TaxID=4232 RepID=A0A251V6P9_HELAN|nr:hypothetical protein HanXRQr2_Chr03g0090571 [Helianthus annuus]KAJ0606607.1 hypothetical protein HanHA89_Chr03g0087051 [Helianthus annuus]
MFISCFTSFQSSTNETLNRHQIKVMLSLPCSNDCRHTLIIATSPSISKVATGLFFGGLISASIPSVA